jgi:hypothetical protein
VKEEDFKTECPSCGLRTHHWSEIYYSSGSILIKADKQYISWCPISEKFVFSTTELNSLVTIKHNH